MTNEEWQKAENELAFPGGHVKLMIDGYAIDIFCVPEKPMHCCLMVYVNGKSRIECCLEDCEIRRKFYFKSKKSLLTAEEKKRLEREKKAVREEIEKRATYYTYYPFFYSFRSLKTHLIHNNESIEMAEGE